jgi:signal transduction histidine kinase/DNA-binding response OmpR family regulator
MKKMISTLFYFLIFLTLCTTVNAKTLRVGYLGYKGFIAPNEDGIFEGYGVEYLNEIARYTDFTYEYVYCSWNDSLEMLLQKEIDLVCTAKFTIERAQKYDFSNHNFGHVQGVLYTWPENPDLYYNDFSNLNGKKIGILKGSLNIEIFAAYAKKRNFSYETVLYDSDEEMANALKKHEIDAIASEHMSYHNDLRLIGNYSSYLYYLMSYKDNDFMDEINEAMNEIVTSKLNYEANLYEKYYADTIAIRSLNLTREEMEYIKNADTIKVGQLRNHFPLSIYDEKNKQLTGINIDILNEISKVTGLQFTNIPLEIGDQAIVALADEEDFDVIMGTMINDTFKNNPNLVMSSPFLTSTLSVVTKKNIQFDSTKTYKIVLKKGFMALDRLIKEQYPDFTVTFYNSDEECLSAVKNGTADFMIQNILVSNYLMQKPQYSDLQIIPASFLPDEYSFLTRRNNSTPLISILNKAIRYIPQEKIENILLSHTIGNPYQLSTKDILYKYKIPFTFILVLLLISIALCTVIIIIRQRNLALLSAKNNQLQEAINRANLASKAKSEFLARMSHEIRTPMNAIVGITTIAKHHKEDPEKVEIYLDKIDSSSKILLNIINDVLDMAAIESNKLKVSVVEFDIKDILNGISTIYYTQCKNKGIVFNVTVNIEYEILKGDSLRVNQILLNLISNAYKFTDAGGSIKLSVTETSKQNDTVFIRFTITDTGCGMSQEMLSRLFMPFEQESATTAKKHGGSGLGLSITKNLVELMHGRIKVESEVDKGSTFTVDIPFVISDNQLKGSDLNLANIKCLIVDDEESAREYTSILLQRIGVQYEIASSGEEAVIMLHNAKQQNYSYDLCFIDWQMSGIDGIEVTKQIRELFTDTMIIIVSAFDISSIVEEAKIAGASMCISKPLFQSTIFNLLTQLYGKKITKETADPDDYDFTGHKILLVDDVDFNREVAVELLEMVKVTVDCAANGQEAVDKFLASEPGTYDLILMDVQMPIMDGHDATRIIRHSPHPDAQIIPIYAMTANAFTDDVSAALSVGMNGHISKPIDTTFLYKTMQNVFSKEKQ